MFKTFKLPRLIATGALSLALAMGAVAPTPAQADDNFRNFALGAAGIIVLGTILNEQQRRQGNYGHVNRAPQRQHVAPQRPHRAAVLPARCIRGHGRNGYVAAPCLRHSGYRVNALPNQCRVQVRGGPNGFGLGCLRRSGYQFG
ncbi:hypothetical protein [Anianabacter salinae]|uniref:hypothetical protein n=1 Tax=Anianabacter salinae TaxID=2851023 RepID=UPI00225DE165|nr:hypothetical protein [Anianabacter salinae]MBV0913638.1 hypothetical protein [Anianabacter salinae]